MLLKPINKIYYVVQPNLGLGYLAAVMLERGHDVAIVDSGKENLRWEGFVKLIEKEKYDLICIQMFTHELGSVSKHIEIIKKYSPLSTVICGGPHISCLPEETMNLIKGIDFGFVAEAEAGLSKFMQLSKQDYGNCDVLETIPNLVWRKNGQIKKNKIEEAGNLDNIKFPAWQLMPPAGYPVAPHGSFCKKIPVAPIIISRGCPFHCTFCGGKSVTGKTIRYRSPGNVISEIKLLYEKYGVREIHIEDDNFTFKREYVIDFCNAILKSGLSLAFALPNGARLDTFDEEVLRLMEKAGFYSMALGIESGNNRILGLMQKELTREEIEDKVALIKRCTKFNLTGFFLIGYPQETEAEILETIAFAKNLRLDKASFMFAMPLPGTKLWEIFKQKNKSEVGWDDFFYYKVVKGLSEIPASKIKLLQRKAVREFYLRPGIIFGLLGEVKSFSQINIIIKRLAGIFIPKP